jgi:phosphonate transport system substrate-binding protein
MRPGRCAGGVSGLKRPAGSVDLTGMTIIRSTPALAVLAALTLLGACGAPAIGDRAALLPAASVAPRAGTVVIGSVGDDAVEEAKKFQPFADALAQRLEGAGVQQGRVIVAPSMAEMTRLMSAGKVDLFIDSPYPALTVAQGAGAVPILQRWKDGVARYRSVVFVRADSAITTADALRGARIGFDDDFSTSGYFLPKAALIAAGLTLTPLPTPSSPVPAGAVGYVFTEDDENTLFWVTEGRAEAGAMSENELRELAGDRFGDLRILATSPEVPRQVVIRAGGLAPDLAAAIETVLTAMHQDAAGAQVLANFEGTTRFDRLDAPTRAQLDTLIGQVPPATG